MAVRSLTLSLKVLLLLLFLRHLRVAKEEGSSDSDVTVLLSPGDRVIGSGHHAKQ